MRLLCGLVVVSCFALGAGAQEIFSDGFEWGSICAWSNLWYPDIDGDGCGDELGQGQTVTCPAPFGLAGNNLDCDDNDPNNFPGNEELCDRQDNDCDGSANGVGEVNGDGDPVWLCEGDCDDGDADNYPGNIEVCDRQDNDCVGGADGVGEVNGDGDPVWLCEGDCDDGDGDNYPGNVEICDGRDNNCNSFVDQAEVPVSVLCPAVPNAVQDCAGAAGCSVLSCNPADTYFDVNGLYVDGCECLALPTANLYGSCVTADDLGTLSDVAGDLATVFGNTPFAGRVIWYRFYALDDADVSEDEFLVDVFFTTNPGTNYSMDVYKDACPGSGGTLMASSVSSYYSSPPGSPSSDDSAWWFVKVYHSDAAAFCGSFSLELSNGVYR